MGREGLRELCRPALRARGHHPKGGVTMSFPTEALTQFLDSWGYWAVLAFIMIECLGIPFPGETMLLIAAVYAGTTHTVSIVGVIIAASVGAAVGGNIGYWAGREGGY